MFAWNLIAKLTLLMGISIGFLAYFCLAALFGDVNFTKGLSFVAGGVSIVIIDSCYRFLNNRDAGRGRFWFPDCGGCFLAIPMWAIGILGIVGGFTVMFSRN